MHLGCHIHTCVAWLLVMMSTLQVLSTLSIEDLSATNQMKYIKVQNGQFKDIKKRAREMQL